MGNFCLAPFLYDTKSHTLMPQLIRRHFEHFSAYLLPGSLRVGYSKYTDGLDVTAWKRPDGALAAVLLNRSGETLPVCLRLVVPENGGTDHRVVFIQGHQPVHLTARADAPDLSGVQTLQQPPGRGISY